jgi:hypothetical protein
MVILKRIRGQIQIWIRIHFWDSEIFKWDTATKRLQKLYCQDQAEKKPLVFLRSALPDTTDPSFNEKNVKTYLKKLKHLQSFRKITGIEEVTGTLNR